ncbi:hypothetical protein [Aquamicrobium sp.]|uniref:hypothetical protein n=1 Tax=Aquamicrobium sp. TaxID=1872579 RepID=UPI00258B85E1|nr:hypothetical protein [Aquamicrobium sp.]MCK9552332.1 hypothetical protein [Aquamicrobium sp.]
MADWSETKISLIGAKIDEAKEYFNSFIKIHYLFRDKLLDTKTDVESKIINEIMILDEIIMTDDRLIINGCGKRNGPLYFIKHLAKKFKLTGSYIDREPGSNFTRVTRFEDGECVFDKIDGFISQLAFDNCSNLHGDAYFVYSENPELDYPKEIKLFFDNGITLDDLKEYHGVA